MNKGIAYEKKILVIFDNLFRYRHFYECGKIDLRSDICSESCYL